MVIDFHTHIFPDAIASRAITSLAESINYLYHPVTNGSKTELLQRMDEWGVDVSVAMPVITKPSQHIKTNDFAKSATDGRVISFGGIHPDTDDYKRDVDYVVSLGLKGIKLHAEYQNFKPDETRMLRIYDYAFSKGLIILHHAGFDPGKPSPFNSTPERFAKMLDEIKGGTFVLAHLGGHAMWDDVERYLVGRDVYFDTAMGFECFPSEQFLRIVRNHGADKILFATDSPWSNASRELEVLGSLSLSDEEKQLILSGNARRLLKIADSQS